MAFAKSNATATDLSPKTLDASPSNYTSLGSLIDPTKPDVRDLYIQTFGDQGITGLLDVTGAKRSAGTADEVHWYEEGRMNRKLNIATSSGTATIQDAYGYVAASMTADQVVQTNDVLIAANGERLIVTGSITGDTFAVKQMTNAAATDATQDVVILGNAYAQGTSQPTKPFQMELVLRKNPYIITKETFHVNGSQATNIGWLNVNGQNMWYLKGEMDARKKFMNSREAMLVFGQTASSAGAPTAGGVTVGSTTVTGSEGYFQAVENRGIVSATAGDQNFDSMDDLDSILILLDKEGAPAEYAMYVDRGTSLAVDDLLASGIATQVTAGLAGQFGAFNNDSDMAINLGFKSFTRGGYTFHKHDWKLLNSDYAAGHTSYQGALIPLGTVVDPKNGGSNPSLEMNYKAAGNYSREMEHWVEGGGVLGYATNGDDLAKFHYRSECNLCVRAANQHVVLKGNNLTA
jgi:hypothetical protein